MKSLILLMPIALAALLLCEFAHAADNSFTLDRTPTGGVDVKVNGQPFATYVVDQANKPYLWPIYGPTGKLMARSYPMKDVAGEQRDHPHHRGITFGHENTNGMDTWTEAATYKPDNPHLKMLGAQKHRYFTELNPAPESAIIAETLDYLDHDGKPFMSEQRRLTFRVIGETRSIDFDQDLIAGEKSVKFTDAKDAGLSIRVPTSMAVDTKQGGRIVNSNGVKDADAWGKTADWCDYTGPVDGETLGVAMLDHPTSFRHATHWHVRTYGLFTANPFGSQCFDKSAPDFAFELKAGERIKLRHRFIFHKGDEKQAGIGEMWEAYAQEQR